MSKNSSAKYYQYNKKRLQKDIKIYQKKKTRKSNNMDVNDINMLLR